MSILSSSRSLAAGIGCVAFAMMTLVGCGPTNKFSSYEPTDIARFALPFEQDVPSHPDSLKQVRIVEEDEKVQIVPEQGFQQIVRNWSVQRRNPMERTAQQRATDYATFWAMDPSFVSLQVETGVSSLTKDKALELIEQRRTEVEREIQIDVYWFTRPSATVGSATAYLLTDEKSRYSSTRREISPLRDGFLPSGQRILHRRVTYFFDRIQNDEDILEGTTSIELEVNRVASSSRDSFTWSWKEAVEDERRAASEAAGPSK